MGDQISFFHEDASRSYYQCSRCRLVFVPDSYYPTEQTARERYEKHNNSLENRGYLDFLGTVVDPLSARLPEGARGLDFGSGPVPAVSFLLREKGYPVEIYDLFFADNRRLLEVTYDFLICVETVEHFFYPAKEWRLLTQLVRPGGWIAIKTEPLLDETDFATWHYKTDITHVCFYSPPTLRWLANTYHLRLDYESVSVTIFEKRG